jgi:hypothetical protein
MKWNYKNVGCHSIFAMIAVAALVVPALAQQATIRSVRFYSVKFDRLADFQGAIKEYNEIVKKGGSDRYFTVWVSVTGASEYLRVDNYTKWADLDPGPEPKLKEQAADLQRISTRIGQCAESMHRVLEEELPELSLPRTGELPKMIRVLQTKVRPDKVNEFLELSKSEALPAYKKSGLKFYSVSHVRFGGPAYEYVSVSGLDHWADFDEGYGLEKALGKEGYQHFLNKLRPLVVENEFNVYRFLPDLSYLPTTSGK